MTSGTRVWVSGGGTLIGRALIDLLHQDTDTELVGVGIEEPDVTDSMETHAFFTSTRPEVVYHCAGLSGGIGLNRACPVELMRDNLLGTLNVLEASHRAGVRKLVYLASSCAYPKYAPQPMAVESLGTGPMEPTSEAYSTAKFAGWKLCDAYRRQHGCNFVTAFPANAFGPHDDFEPASGHVIPALIRRAHDARTRGEEELVVWGSGEPRREFVYARDLARAARFVAENDTGEVPINLGGGTDLSIAQVAQTVAEVVGFRGTLRFDTTRPDGAPLKALDSRPLLQLGWQPETSFRSALELTYNWFLRHLATEGNRHVREAL